MPKGLLGAQLYTIRKYTQTLDNVKSSFEKIREIGYRAVQISGFGPIDPQDVAKLAQDNELTIASTHFHWNMFLNDLDRMIDTHKIWQCVHPAIGGLPKEYQDLDGLDRFLKELTPVTEKFKAEGMDFSYHNHSHELVKFGNKTWLEILYEKTDPADLKAEIDVYWIQHGGGDPAYWIKKVGLRQPLLHLKDMIITVEREQRYAEIKEGNLNWSSILAAADSVGVEWYLVEQDDCYERDPFDSLAISYRNLARIGFS